MYSVVKHSYLKMVEKAVKDKLVLGKISVDNPIIIRNMSQFVNSSRKC